MRNFCQAPFLGKQSKFGLFVNFHHSTIQGVGYYENVFWRKVVSSINLLTLLLTLSSELFLEKKFEKILG